MNIWSFGLFIKNQSWKYMFFIGQQHYLLYIETTSYNIISVAPDGSIIFPERKDKLVDEIFHKVIYNIPVYCMCMAKL